MMRQSLVGIAAILNDKLQYSILYWLISLLHIYFMDFKIPETLICGL